MGVTANPMPGKFQSIMRKIKNVRDAEIYTAKHYNDKVKNKPEKNSEEEE